jgi:hypothetical protein
MVFEVPIGTRSTNRHSKYQLVFEVPIGIWNTNAIAFLSASIWNSILQIGIWDTK